MEKRWPDFFVVGAMKAGTTTLHDHLASNSHVFMVRPKEPGYFSQPDVYARGDEWYLSLFANAGQEQCWGDGSTCYSRWPTYPDVPARIHARNPNAKFIYVVRDPVKRAYSHYRHRMEEVAMHGGEFMTFSQAIERDEEMMMAGRYADQLQRFLEFFPLDRFYIFDFQQMVANPQAVLTEVFNFLGVPLEGSGAIESKTSNQAGEVLVRRRINNSIKSFRRLPVVKQVFDLMSPDMRKGLSNFASKTAQASPFGKRIAKDFLEEIKPPTAAEIEFLSNYYAAANSEFTALTGCSTASWTAPSDLSVAVGK
ncbi:sulfotransferase [Halioxenophilus sp. WMMB6]|uniref:sulfotransferase n=1 Tax=Halioxenophilus sp. WMMB6 TaxID=3073815 RepID=UPI00295F396D|nr:sulfotransferase [Halioxenophilus sp. WMMB6]